MRVLHIVEATIAGVRTHVQTLATGLNPRRFQSVVACPLRRQNSFGDDQFVHDLTSAGIRVVPVAMQRSIGPLGDAAALSRLSLILRREQFDLIHLHSSKAGFLGRAAARLAGVAAPVVYSPHGFAFLGAGHPARRRAYLALEQLAGPWCDRIIAVSPGERTIALHAGLAGPDQVVCIPNGIAPVRLPPAYDRAAMRRQLGQPSGAPLIGTVARLAAQKNPRLFLDAAARVLRARPDARFVWCGGGELADLARAQAHALGIAPACQFLGHRDDAAQVLAALDMFWLTSDYEGMPLAPLEALALHVPIVASDVVGTRDLLQGTAGLLVPPRDPAAFADAALRLLGNPGRRAQLAQAGYRHYLEQGTSRRMLDAVEQLYAELAANRTYRIAMPVAASEPVA